MSSVLYNAAVEQTFSVWSAKGSESDESIKSLLKEGWQIVSVTGAGAGQQHFSSVCFFVVLERRRA